MAEKIRLYRAARAEQGYDPEAGQVTLMLHTYIGEDRAAVREAVRVPFTNYLRSSAGLIANLAQSANIARPMSELTQEDMDALLAFAFDRYFETSALFGTVESCVALVDRLKAIGVNEIGCLIDFGIDVDTTLAALQRLNRLRELVNQPVETAGASLAVQARRHHATLLQGTPSLAKLLLLQPDTREPLRALRALLLGGEALPPALAQQLLPLLSGRLINMYGPTETTIWSATHPVTSVPESNMPIGRPIANTEIYLLDAQMEPVPIGIASELYIGGVGVTRGYYGHPALTAERFVPDPYGARPGGRLYKTGDLARYLPDGTIEFLGRIDQQVKLRGFRIELGEIEAALSQHPDVREAVVVARQDSADDVRLVAYLVENQEQSEDQEPEPRNSKLLTPDFRAYLKERLPDYMIPAAFVTLEALPLTPNGKVDRKALPMPDAALTQAESAMTLPRTPTEEVVAAIWQRVLGAKHVGVHDNFFMLGGHSLLATQILSRVRETFQVELALSTLFNTPTVAGMAEQITLAQQMARGLPVPPIEVVSRDRPLPLSFAQQRLWVLHQLDPESAAYTDVVAMRLQGDLDLRALSESLNTIVRRHEALRTTFPMIDGAPVQQIAPRLTLDLPLVDLSDRPADAQRAQMLRIGSEETRRPFDLATGPLIRALIFKHAEHDHVVMVMMHHIISDGWSIGVLIQEMAALYGALSTSPSALEASLLPELPIQYADYAAWQREWLQGEVLEAQQAYWKQQLSGEIPALNLPTDHPRPPIRTYRGAKQSIYFPKPLLDGLMQLSRSAGTTLFMTLLSGLNTLLYRYTGQTDLVIGSPIANRHHGEVERLIGCFINTLVLRTDLSGDPSFADLLQRVREVALGAYAHQDLPFEQVVEIAEYEQDISRHPLFQVMFILQNAPMSTFKLGDLTLTTVDMPTETAKFDLAFELIEIESGIFGFVQYNTDLFEAATITRLVGHFERLLEQCVADPEQRISDLSFLADDERQKLLVDWNGPTATYPDAHLIHELIAQQAARTPDAVAVIFEDTQLTYAELNARANQLAHHLRSCGVGPEVRVGLCLHRSLDLVVGLLGILKAGGAYVPLDPAYPQARLAFQVQDAQVPVIVTQQELAETLHLEDTSQGAQVVCLDAAPAIAAWPNTDPISGAKASDLAYLIYTSGTTGRPKAVQVEHGSLRNTLLASQERFGFQADDTMPWIASIAFDITLFELFNPLLAGGTALIVSQAEVLDLPRFSQTLRRCTRLHAVPSLMRQIVLATRASAASPTDYAIMRQLFVGGDSVPAELLSAMQNAFPGAEVTVLYGPTEATIICTSYSTPRGHTLTGHPIGTPLPNVLIRLYDTNRQLVPIGVHGELYVGGAGRTRGYLHQPELTAEKFVEIDGQRWYRTGDLARYLPDGTIEFLGRSDHQVKLRGFRIELAEIEAVLRQHPAIQESVVLVWEHQAETRGLVAYLVPQPGAHIPGTDELRHSLGAMLPDYMIPAAFVVLDALPLTQHGKLDRKALPAPDLDQHSTSTAFVAPRTSVEATLAQIWGDVLRREQIGIHDNFFALGGDSILVIQVIARANQAGLHLTPKQLFQHRTIAELSTVVQTSAVAEAEQGVVTGDVPLTPIQQHFFALDLAEPNYFNQAMLFQVSQPFDLALLEQAARQLVAHHDALRLRYAPTPSGWQQQIVTIEAALAGSSIVSSIDLSAVPVAGQSTAITAAATEVQRSLDLTAGPIFRIASIDLGADQPGRLLLAIHHLAVDGVSWPIVLADLQTAYTQLSQGAGVALPPKTTSFKYWAERLSVYAEAPALHDQLDYWLHVAQHSVAPMPVDHPDGVNTAASEARIKLTLSADETHALLHDVPPVYHTQINDLLLTALMLAWSEWTGDHALRLDLEGHGREDLFERVDLSRTVGWFTTIFPVLLDLEASHEPGRAIKAIKERLRQIPQRGIGYGLLRHLGPAEIQEQLSDRPASEVGFNYLGQLDQAVPSDGWLSVAAESPGATQSPRERRAHQLEVTGFVAGGQLHLEWAYSANRHERSTIERLVAAYERALRSLIAHCLSPDAGGYTPSDFPLARVDQAALDRVLSRDRQIEDLYPLSPVQQGMIFHTVYTEGTGVYVEQIACRLTGPLDIAAFQQAWATVVERHAIFRTEFAWEGLDRPLQLVRRRVEIPWQIEDWRHLSADEQAAELRAFLDDDRQRGYALHAAPLLRLALFQVGAESYDFVWSHHHVLLDGWSLPLIFNEVFHSYELIVQDETLQLPQIRPYRDYIAWLQQQDLAQAEAFWRQLLVGFTAPTPFGVDRRSAASVTSDQASLTFAVSEATSLALQELVRQHGLTMNTLVQGAWALLLSHYSGEQDIVYGATVAGRPADLIGVEQMVGLFINTLPVRVRVDPDATLLSWLGQLQELQVELRQYEYTPLAQIQSWSSVPRGQALFESIVVFENYPVATAVQPSSTRRRLTISDVQSLDQTNYPLTIIALQEPVLQFTMTYDTSRFDAATIERMQQHLHVLIEQIIAAPTQPLAKMTVLPEHERQQVLVEWNATAADYPQDVCLHTLIEQQAQRTPDAVALVFEDRQLTYAALNARANQLAHALRAMGVGGCPQGETRVAVCMERSLELVVSLLAVLKAGGAYVPLDPSYPQERLAFMLEDAAAPVLLTQQHIEAVLPAHAAQVLRVDTEWERIARQPDTNPASAVRAANLAYMIYTSGSTGQPKGAMNTHQAIVNRLLWMQDAYQLTPSDRVLQKTPFSFDVSVWEFFWPLLTGATLVVAKPGGHQDPAYLVELIARERITTLHFVPSMLQVFLEERDLDRCTSLRRVICSGEALPLALQQRFFARLDAELHNLYGPTEAAVDVTFWPCAPDRALHTVPIGYPVANTQIYLLDRHLHPVPIGVPGELHIGGIQLARGYHRRPALTAEKFIPDPFSQTPNARLYKTGDLARSLPDGAIEYLGRLDFQVKVRGFRIELGEIETALGQHPQVREAVVLARQDPPPASGHPDARLVAYVVEQRHNGAAELSVSELRRFLEPTLPEYMVPSVFVFLDALPLSPNGKVDRKALPAPDSARPELEATFAAPHTQVEETLAAIWKQVLGLEQVGIHDNFLELGGDSILSLQVVARTNEAGLRLSPAQIFQHRTIAELAAVIGTGPAVQAEQGVVTGAVPLTPIQQWFFEQQFDAPHHWNQAVLLEARQPLDPALLEPTMQQLAAHHDALRLRFIHDAHGWQQHNAAITSQPLVSVVDLSAVPASEQAEAITQHAAAAQASLDLTHGPLLRATYFDLGPDQPARLLLVIHHLAVDGVSWRILLDDLQTVYEQLSQGQAVALPAKSTAFKHWAERLQAFAQAPELLAERDYWTTRPWSALPPLPVDGADERANTEESTQRVAVKLSAEETRALLQDAPQAYNTQINDLLLTALAQTFADWTGRQTMLLNLEGHGREDLFGDVDVSRTVGWFTSLFPVVLDLRHTHGTGEAIVAVKEQLRELPRRGVGYGILRYLSQDAALREQLHALPQAQVIFNYMGQLDQILPEESPFALAKESRGPERSPSARRSYLLEINAAIIGGQLQLELAYSPHLYRRTTIEDLAYTYLDTLQALIGHCLAPEAGAYTPSDFAEFEWSQDSLDNITDIIRKSIGDV
ncbi:MAG TPA: amino acid adenylation domain-containing protein [Herpetosiphonaceae bacterium]